MRRKFLFLAFICSVVTSAQAQRFKFKLWTWDTYKMQFQAPDSMDITQSDAKGFGATNKLISLNIYPRKGENLNYSGMKSALMKWAVDTKLQYKPYNASNGEKQPFYMGDLNKYTGCAIEGIKGLGLSESRVSSVRFSLVTPSSMRWRMRPKSARNAVSG